MEQTLLVLLIMDGVFFAAWLLMLLLRNKANIPEKHTDAILELVKYVTSAIVGYQVAAGAIR